ncbi:hypothetical protein BIFANG_02441 [Bifidobacterium angulatum DSM 20098 = JCM 7096]|uniref:Uncharacterized protein n=1 Tax=Bifidobacterium angulatum DSM 20098 = JCM 7096 TaxID=518635 RepID=C4FDQ4_9BIFI|nr:hypothetical protein BIFANG_02441 [Bifidobacterium angulatum DSM 20098 = JCM 7096]
MGRARRKLQPEHNEASTGFPMPGALMLDGLASEVIACGQGMCRAFACIFLMLLWAWGIP